MADTFTPTDGAAADDGLICVVYLSRAARPMSPEELLSLLRQSRASNDRDGITGLLLYRGGCFMQALEGPREIVLALLRRISMDARHGNVTTLIKFSTQARAFAGWSMGFADIDRLPVGEREGVSAFLQDDFEPARWTGAPHQAVRLLKAFRDTPSLVATWPVGGEGLPPKRRTWQPGFPCGLGIVALCGRMT